MTHAFFMIIPVVLMAVSVIQLLDAVNRNSRLIWLTVFVVAVTLLLVHITGMEILY